MDGSTSNRQMDQKANAVSDPLYVKSVVYHEAGHMVVAAAQGLQVLRYGIRVRDDGTGVAYYRGRKPLCHYPGPSEISREHTIVAAFAGLIAQQKFHSKCSVKGADSDNELIVHLLSDMKGDDGLGCVGSPSLAPKLQLKKESRNLVDRHWPAIGALATELWDADCKPRDYQDPEQQLSQSKSEKMLEGVRVVKILQPFGIHASIWDSVED
jgi:hypothetical protein